MTTIHRPAWLTQRIIANARKARLDTCGCGTFILAGLDDDQCAFPTVTDITTLTWAGELAAIHLEQRGTYELVNGELWRRHHWHYEHAAQQPVLPEHRCGQPIPTTWTTTIDTLRKELPDEPEF